MIGRAFMTQRVIFDFDGVLANSLSITMEKINFLHTIGFDKLPKVFTQKDMSELFDVKLRDSLHKYGYGKSETKNFFDLHTQLMCQDAHRVPVFDRILNFVENSPRVYSVVSSSYFSYMETVICKYSNNALQFFDEVFGRETQGSKEEKIYKVISAHNLKKEEIIYVGDTASDILTCKEIGIRIIAVGYGFHPYGYLQKFEPDYCVRSERELIELLKKLLYESGINN